MAEARIAVLISGQGSNLQALLDAPQVGPYVALVLSNKAEAYGLVRAQTAGVAVAVVDHKAYADRQAFDAAVDAVLRQHGITLVVLAGFMRLLTGWFVDRWCGRIVNIHPSLLPAFKGGSAIADALAYGVKVTGVTVHFVTQEMDAGPIIAQTAVPVLPEETLETLKDKIHAAEHALYPRAVADVMARRVVFKEECYGSSANL